MNSTTQTKEIRTMKTASINSWEGKCVGCGKLVTDDTTCGPHDEPICGTCMLARQKKLAETRSQVLQSGKAGYGDYSIIRSING